MFHRRRLDFFEFGRDLEASGRDFLHLLFGELCTHALARHEAVEEVHCQLGSLALHPEIRRDALHVVHNVGPSKPVLEAAYEILLLVDLLEVLLATGNVELLFLGKDRVWLHVQVGFGGFRSD